MSVDVSVIIPVYNRASLIGRAVRSVLRQTYENFELVIVDDGSTDDTEAVVRSFRDSRIRYVRREVNGGNAAARNTGVNNSSGRLVAWLDSDDEYTPDFLMEVCTTLEGTPPEIGFTWTGRAVADDTDVFPNRVRKPLRPKRKSSANDYIDFLNNFRGGTGSGLTLKRECFEEVGYFDERLRASVDRDFTLRLVQHYGFRKTDKKLLLFHNHDGHRASRNSAHQASACELIIEKHRAILEQHPHLWARYHYQAGRLHYRAGNKSRGRQMLMQSLTKRPLYLKGWIAMLAGEIVPFDRTTTTS
jgi:glycosyltransferase involved in cell wall biosynthesis